MTALALFGSKALHCETHMAVPLHFGQVAMVVFPRSLVAEDGLADRTGRNGLCPQAGCRS